MEKILLAFDARQMDISTIDFACYVADLTRSKLTALCMENERYEMRAMHDEYNSALNMAVREEIIDLTQRNYEENIRLFEKSCRDRGIRAEVIRCDTKQPARKLIAESRFADLVIIKPETSFEKQFEGTPSHFTTEVLAGAECPVLVAPPGFEGVDEIIFTYDGSSSSVFAIKQFTYLFPQLSDKKALVLEVQEKPGGHTTAREQIGELLKAHYSSIGFDVLHGKTTSELLTYLLSKKTSMVVMGAFGKPGFQQFLRQSTATPLMRTINCPFFITHC